LVHGHWLHVSGPVVRQSSSWWKSMVEQSCLLHDSQKTEKVIGRNWDKIHPSGLPQLDERFEASSV
jgi:hypothetical protein